MDNDNKNTQESNQPTPKNKLGDSLNNGEKQSTVINNGQKQKKEKLNKKSSAKSVDNNTFYVHGFWYFGAACSW